MGLTCIHAGVDSLAVVDVNGWLIPAVVAAVAVSTSLLSAIAGLGGGVILLGVLAQFFAPTVAIPIQGGIQLFANGSRAVSLRRDISWSVAGWAALLLLPASILGAAVSTAVPVSATRITLGVFLLVMIWRPKVLRFEPTNGPSRVVLVGVGAVSGLINSTVGASGPFTSPFFRAATASHVAFVATAATSQVTANPSKLVAFGLSGFSPMDYIGVIAAGSSGAVLGTMIGTRLLGNVNEVVLARIFRTVLTLLALRLVLRGLGVL